MNSRILSTVLTFIVMLSTSPHSAASGYFFQTAFISGNASNSGRTKLSWRDLGFDQMLLQHVLLALKGDLFKSRPPEWDQYLNSRIFEDENLDCLIQPESWKLVAVRIIPGAFLPLEPRPELRLSFQPFCLNEQVASDTSIQLTLVGPEQSWSAPLFTMLKPKEFNSVYSRLTAKDAGFVTESTLRTSREFPAKLDSNLFTLHLRTLREKGFKVDFVRWMASHPGQLDWIFGQMKMSAHTKNLKPLPIQITNAVGETLLDLGWFDFLALPLREPYQRLSATKKQELKKFHVMQDPHLDRSTAHKVLEIDRRVSSPWRTQHSQSSCIQCHSAQERMERTESFLAHGGAKEFGYFFRGLGYIEDQMYISWRSLQESVYLDEAIKARITTSR